MSSRFRHAGFCSHSGTLGIANRAFPLAACLPPQWGAGPVRAADAASETAREQGRSTGIGADARKISQIATSERYATLAAMSDQLHRGPGMIDRLHHVAIVTSDLEGSVAHWAPLLGSAEARVVVADRPGVRLRTTMLSIARSGSYLQVFEPREGPGLSLLRERGEGAILEVGLQTHDIRSVASWIREEGGTPRGLSEDALKDDCLVSAAGNRYLFLPPELSRGTRVEVVELVQARGSSSVGTGDGRKRR